MSRKTVLVLIPILCSICITTAAQERSSLWKIHTDAGQEAMKKRQYEEAERHFEQALREAEYIAVQDHRLILSIDNLALSRHFQKKYVEAKPFTYARWHYKRPCMDRNTNLLLLV